MELAGTKDFDNTEAIPQCSGAGLTSLCTAQFGSDPDSLRTSSPASVAHSESGEGRRGKAVCSHSLFLVQLPLQFSVPCCGQFPK